MLLVAGQAQGMGSKPDPGEFRRACMRGDVSQVKAMLYRGADVHAVNESGCSILTLAVCCGRPLVVTQLIAAGADVNAVDKYGVTALMYAAWAQKPSVVTQLIAAGANVNAVATNGFTTLMYAAHGERYTVKAPIVMQLIDAGAAVYPKNKCGETVLGFFEMNGRTEAAAELRKEMKWQGQGGEKAAWFAAVVQQQRAASRPGRVEVVE